MAATIAGAFEPETQNAVKTSRILLVGAGGIGCEVLKNLVLMGFAELEVIDLDTIEVSNLNRQFLFNKESVGKSKSHVARESVLEFNPNVNINSHFGDITDRKYGSAFFNKFKLVINALDNKRARSHVNRMCLSNDIPLLESGTMGFSGQVEFIKKSSSCCYECFPKPESKEYPMCTIRNTPKEVIHCIIWAKFLFGQLYGEDSEEDVSMEETIDEQKMTAREWAVHHDYDEHKLFKKIFYDDIDYLLSMPDLFACRGTTPVKLDSKYLSDEFKAEYVHEPENKLLSLAQYVEMFKDSARALKIRLRNSEVSLAWDKDDDDIMNFVVSSTNLRSKIFDINLETHFGIKSKAGNIIPAIATANAIIAGQIVIHALRVLRGKYSRCQTVFLRSIPNHKGGIMVRDKKVELPNPKCIICSTSGVLTLVTDLHRFTVRQLEDVILRNKLNIVAPDVLADSRMIISSDEDDELDLYSKTLYQADIIHGTRLVVEDFLQNYRVQIIVNHKIRENLDEPEFKLVGNVEEAKVVETKDESRLEESDEDDFCEIEENADSGDVITWGVDEFDEEVYEANDEVEDGKVDVANDKVENGKMEEANLVVEDGKEETDKEIIVAGDEQNTDNTETEPIGDYVGVTNGKIQKGVVQDNVTTFLVASSDEDSGLVTDNQEASDNGEEVIVEGGLEVVSVETNLEGTHDDDGHDETLLALKRKAEETEEIETKKYRQSDE